MSTREEWLMRASQLIYDQLIAPVAVIKEGERWAVTCGWPSKHALSVYRRRIGECWPVDASADKSTRHIFISPLLEEVVDGTGEGVLATLTHELVHAVVAEKGHRGEFRRIALALGFEPPMTATPVGSELAEKLAALAKQLGPYPHTSIVHSGRTHKQTTRMIKVMAIHCTECQYVARTTRVWLNEFGPPKCPHGSPMEEVK